jgi:hypothetical protein
MACLDAHLYEIDYILVFTLDKFKTLQVLETLHLMCIDTYF